MNNVDFIFDAPVPRNSKPLHSVFERELVTATQIDIAVGYVSEKSLRRLHEIAEQRSDLTINLTCGMHYREGMTQTQLTHAKALHKTLSESGRGGVYVTKQIKYHGKIYLFTSATGMSCYVGSANLSSILAGHTDTMEAGMFFPVAPVSVTEHLHRDVYPQWEPVGAAAIPLVPDRTSPMHNVEEAQEVSTAEVVQIMTSPATHTFYLPLKANPSSSLNAHLSGGGMRAQKFGGGLARSWYEGELIVSQKITRLPGYPQGGVVFNVVTDDGWTFECMTSGGPDNNKNFRSKGDLSIFGTWMKSRLIEAGALEFGETATQANIDRYGRKYLTLKYHPEFDLWSLNLSVNEHTPVETPAQIVEADS